MFFQLAQKSFGSAPELTVGQLAFFKSDVKADSSKHLKFRELDYFWIAPWRTDLSNCVYEIVITNGECVNSKICHVFFLVRDEMVNTHF